MSRRWRLALGAFLSLFLAGVASAHRIRISRFASPIPLSAVFVGAGATVGVTALWLGYSENVGGESGSLWPVFTLSPGVTTAITVVGRTLFFLGFLAAILTGLFGRQVRAENFATVFVWPVWITGVGLASIVFGCPWRVFSPWRTLYESLCWLEGEELELMGTYPTWLGVWPALVGFLGVIGILENLTVVPRSPHLAALFVVSYALVMVLGGLGFGRTWFCRADVFFVLYALFGRVSPVWVAKTRTGAYRVGLRASWQGCLEAARGLSMVVFVVAMVYTVSFDGFTSTPEYQTVLFGARSALGTGVYTGIVLYLVGFIVFIVCFAGVGWTIGVLGRIPPSAAARAFAPTVLPIAAAYEISHYYTYVLRNAGQLLAIIRATLSSTPISSVSPLGWLPLGVFWGSEVLVIVAGHVIAVVAAHHVATREYTSRSMARRAHLPLVVLMIAYTVLSLWIVSRPIVA